MDKNVLLIGGGGTLGTYTAKELLNQGCEVDVVCLEENSSDNEKLRFFKAQADIDYLNEFLKERFYDGIVNFIHYPDVNEYKTVHKLLSMKCKHLVFLSSYRVYADLQIPVTETAPQLYDVTEDEDFLQNEDYAVSKSKAEHFIREESGTDNWTIVRPVISFSDMRLDIVTVNGREVIKKAEKGEKLTLPVEAKNLTAAIDWAGNSGKLIACLVLNDKAFGEAYTVSLAQNLTWGEVAELYTKHVGTEFEWVDVKTYSKKTYNTEKLPWILKYDRMFDRKIDNTKILKVTGLKKEDFASIEEGIKTELEKIKKENRL